MTRFLLLAALAATVVGSASAQGPQRITYRLGIGQFQNSDARDHTDNAPWTIGVGFNLPSKSTSQHGDWGSIDLDGIFSRGNCNRLDIFGLTYTHRWNLSQPTPNGGGVYGGLGAGVYRINVETFYEVVADGEPPIGNTDSSTSTRLGGQIVLGYRLTQIMFLELAYRMSGSVDGVSTNSCYFMLGGRF